MSVAEFQVMPTRKYQHNQYQWYSKVLPLPRQYILQTLIGAEGSEFSRVWVRTMDLKGAEGCCKYHPQNILLPT
jgi:hypothetical protein